MPVAGYRPYDGPRALTYERLRREQREWVRELQIIGDAVVSMPGGSTVLDCPVGTGRFLPLYADRGLQAIGVDVSPDMLRQAQQKGTDARLVLGNITGDLVKTVGGFVDFAVCLRLINWLTEREAEQAFAQLLRVTRKALWVGLWTAATAGQPAASAETQAEDAVTGWVTGAGWTVAHVHVITPGVSRTSAVWEIRRADR